MQEGQSEDFQGAGTFFNRRGSGKQSCALLTANVQSLCLRESCPWTFKVPTGCFTCITGLRRLEVSSRVVWGLPHSLDSNVKQLLAACAESN